MITSLGGKMVSKIAEDEAEADLSLVVAKRSLKEEEEEATTLFSFSIIIIDTTILYV